MGPKSSMRRLKIGCFNSQKAFLGARDPVSGFTGRDLVRVLRGKKQRVTRCPGRLGWEMAGNEALKLKYDLMGLELGIELPRP